MTKIVLLSVTMLLLLVACAMFRPGSFRQETGPYIDSLGLRSAQMRLEKISSASPDYLISRAIDAQDQKPSDSQPEFFQSIEDSYQRYSGLFKSKKRTKLPEVRCDYDLLETFRLQIFDPQPFMNAILHAFPLKDFTTLDFEAKPLSPDTLLVHVSWARASPHADQKNFMVTEGNLDLYVTRHSVQFASAPPGEPGR